MRQINDTICEVLGRHWLALERWPKARSRKNSRERVAMCSCATRKVGAGHFTIKLSGNTRAGRAEVLQAIESLLSS